MKKSSLVLLTCVMLVACNNWQSKKLLGKWQCSALLEDGMPVPVTPSDINFQFFGNCYYNFTSTLNYKEAGTFSVKGGLLYTLDTINEASTEKAVQIINLTEDSLFLKMNADGKERIIKLFKVK